MCVASFSLDRLWMPTVRVPAREICVARVAQSPATPLLSQQVEVQDDWKQCRDERKTHIAPRIPKWSPDWY